MANSARIVHSKVARATTGADAQRVYGTDWNADHVLTGLENVDNTSDATKNAAIATLTNKTIDTAAPNTILINGNALAAAAGTATVTIPNSTDTLVGRNTTDTLANKTLTSPSITGATITTSTYNGNTWTAGTGTLTLGAGKTATISNTLTFTGTDLSSIAFGTGGTVVYTSNNLSVFAATTSAQLAGVISDETGTGALVFATSPTLVTPTLGAASATSINKVAVTAPLTGATLTIADGATLTAPATASVSGTNTGDQTITLTGDVTGSGTGSFAATIATNAITNAKAAQMAAYTIKGNATGSTANASDIDISALTTKASPASGDYIILSDQAASGALKKATVSSVASAGSVSSLNGQVGVLALMVQPQGRLTLTSMTAVMASSVAAATTLYYTPAVGNQIPIYDGTNMVPTAFTEISIATTDTTKNPAAIGASKVNDWFVWNDGGTLRLSHGPDWTNDTTRSAGTALVRVNGIWLNNAAITNGPAASRGTYIGTTRSNGTSTIDYVFGSIASGGGAASFNVWNTYNRVLVATIVSDNTDTWTYAVASTWRAANGSATMRASFVRGLTEDAIEATYMAVGGPGAATNMAAGVGLNSTTVFSGTPAVIFQNGPFMTVSAKYSGIPGLGFNYVSALEYNNTATASTWAGDSNVAYLQSGLHVVLVQ